MTITDFTRFPTGNLCNANPAVEPLVSAIRPLIPGRRVAGRARTARVVPGQNAAIHRAVGGPSAPTCQPALRACTWLRSSIGQCNNAARIPRTIPASQMPL